MLLSLFPSAAFACAVCLVPPPTWHPDLRGAASEQPASKAADADASDTPSPPGDTSSNASGETTGAGEDDADSDPRTGAETAFAAGEAAFVEGDYPTAIAQFERAQALLPHPFTEYNLGVALAHGGRDLEAWRVFTQLHEHATSSEQQADVEEQLAALSPRVARLRIDAPSGQAVTVAGQPADPGEELIFVPGPVELQAGTYVTSLELRGGELRHVDLRSAGGPPAAPDRDQRTVTGVLATAAVFGAGTTGVILASGFLPPADRRPWVMASAGLGGATVALTLTALALHVRARRAGKRRRSRKTSSAAPAGSGLEPAAQRQRAAAAY